jgi:hypothetical protein
MIERLFLRVLNSFISARCRRSLELRDAGTGAGRLMQFLCGLRVPEYGMVLSTRGASGSFSIRLCRPSLIASHYAVSGRSLLNGRQSKAPHW